MSILILYAGYKSRGGGVYNHSLLLLDGLYSLGYSARLYTLDDCPLWFRYIPALLGKLRPIAPVPLILLRNFLVRRYFQYFFVFTRYSAVIFQEIYLYTSISNPSIVFLHALWSDNLQGLNCSSWADAILRSLEASTINHCRHPIVTVSDQYRDYLVREHLQHFTIAPLAVLKLAAYRVAPSVVHSARKPTKPVFDPIRIVSVCSLEHRKNIPLLFNISRKLLQLSIPHHIHIIGDGPLFQTFKDEIESEQLPIILAGRMERSRIDLELRNSDIFILTSLKESFSIALLEAKAAGLITIASSTLHVPPEFVDIPVDHYNAASWVEAILSSSTTTPNHINFNEYTSQYMASNVLQLLSKAYSTQ